MGQKQSSNTYLQPLPEIYEKNDISEVYSLKGFDINTLIGFDNQSTLISNPQTVTGHQTLGQKDSPISHEPKSQSHQQSPSDPYESIYPPFVKHFTILLNKFQTRQYLNHLVYRNQPQFRQFIVQMPFGEVLKQKKYTKVHLYVQELAFTLNQVFNLPFNDMAMVLYTALLAYKYLYSYFGLFKIEANMIGFTREAKAKVWLNHKLTKDKPLPIVSDINLKRHKQQQSYMVDDLLTIFSNKVDKQTIPHNFTLINQTSSIRTSRATRLSYSRISEEVDLSKSTVKSLENNLISDFSDCSFDKCLEYLEGYLHIQRPEFFVVVKDKAKKMSQHEVNKPKKRPHKNFIPSIFELIKTRKQITLEESGLRTSQANININMREITGINQSQVNRTAGLQFKKATNPLTMIQSFVRRPNVMFSQHMMANTLIPQPSKSPMNQQPQHVRFTTTSYIPNQLVTNSNVIQQVNLNKSKSKPKVTFKNSNPTSLYERISPNKVYNSAIVQNHKNKPSSSLQKQQVVITAKSFHSSTVSPQTINQNQYSFRMTTSQVNPIYSKSYQQDAKPVLSLGHNKYKPGTQSNWENQDKHDRDSIIDGVTTV